MQLAHVVIDIPVVALDTPYTYIVPDAETSTDTFKLEVGCAVLVPFGRGKKQEVAYVVDIEHLPASSTVDNCNHLKQIIKVLTGPLFTSSQVDCAKFISKRYVAPLANCIRLFIPAGSAPRMVHTQAGYAHLQEPTVGEIYETWIKLVASDYIPRKGATTQAAILEMLAQAPNNVLKQTDITSQIKSGASAISALEKAGALTRFSRRIFRGQDTCNNPNSIHSAFCDGIDDAHKLNQGIITEGDNSPSQKNELTLTQGQVRAVDAIKSAYKHKNGSVVLVDGVTGSGKTEVYLRAIEDVLKDGKQSIVLVPEISLTPQTVGRFKARFGNTVAVMHSRMSAGERYDMWDFIRSGKANVVVGARSALFSPLDNLGLIIIDEEHESTYKQESSPRYHARDVAIYMARKAGGAVVLGSATPSIEALHAAETQDLWTRVELSKRANGAKMPDIRVVDMSLEFRDGERSMFSRVLLDAIREELSQNNKVVLLLNQRGFANFLLCRDCGFVPTCVHCSTSLTFHENANNLICHHCGYTVVAPSVCPVCGSHYMRRFGAGTERVHAELASLIDSPITRMDADTTTGKDAHARLLSEFSNAPGAAVLLGTQMIAKGLDIPDVTLVGVINADTQLNLPDFRASERTFNLVSQVAGRAGRAQKPGKVIVQTYSADSPAIKFAAAYDRQSFLRNELASRDAFRMPPYARLVNIVLSANNLSKLEASAKSIYNALKSLFFGKDIQNTEGGGAPLEQLTPLQLSLFAPNEAEFNKADNVLDALPEGSLEIDCAVSPEAAIEIFPPCECVISRKHNNYRKHIIVKSASDFDLPSYIEKFRRQVKVSQGIKMSIDIDPLDLL